MIDFALNVPKLVPTMRKLASNISASQLKTWNRCRRLWAFQKVWGVKERPKQAFVIGHVLHSVAERYITAQASSWEELFPRGWSTGLDEHESTWVQSMIRRGIEQGVLQANPGSLVEFPIAALTGPQHVDARGLPLLAKAETYLDETLTRRISALTTLHDGRPLPVGWDATPPFVGFIDQLLLHENPPRVTDHKTAKNRRYATTAGKLAEDIQVLSYAAVPMVLRPEVDLVSVRHDVFIKADGGPDPYIVEVPITFEKVSRTWQAIRRATVEMAQVRAAAPKVVNPSDPYCRADNWSKVRSAIEDGRPDACNEYGGCEMRDICFGRATARQVLLRLDAPVGPPLPPVQFALNIPGRAQPGPAPPPSPPPPLAHLHHEARIAALFTPPPPLETPALPGHHMAFAKPAVSLALNQDVFVLDPQHPTVQYRARILALREADADVALYPNPNVLPLFASLSPWYRTTVPREACLVLPHITAKITGYQDALKGEKVPEADQAWAVDPAAAATATVGTQAPPDRPVADGRFPLNIPGAKPVASAPALTTDTNPPPTGALPDWASKAKPGDVVSVLPTGHPFWRQHEGKHAIVRDVVMGNTAEELLFSVEIEGGPYPAVDARRFGPVRIQAMPAPAAALPREVMIAAGHALVGKHVTIMLAGEAMPLNCVLEAADAETYTVLGTKRPWAQCVSIQPFADVNVPGSKAAEKAAKKAAKLAAKEAAANGTAPAAPPAAVATQTTIKDAATLLQEAIAFTDQAMAGKVTRKVLEALKPMLVQAQAAIIAGNVPGGSQAPPVADEAYAAALDHVQAAIEQLRQR